MKIGGIEINIIRGPRKSPPNRLATNSSHWTASQNQS